LKYYLLLFLVLTGWISEAQNPVEFSLKNSTLAATDSLLPFWFAANQQGKIKPAGSFLNVSDLFISQDYTARTDSTFAFTWGGNLVAAFGENSYYQLNRAFTGISYRGWELKGGMFYDPVQYGGLSTTNGNLAQSGNARPYPMLRLSTQRFKPVPFTKNRLSFEAEYGEGILNDERYVKNARLHHKSLYLKLVLPASWEISGGMEHYVMWGGTSRDERVGQFPQDLKSYWLYITGSSGDESFLETEQQNVAGDQLGTYQLEIKKQFPAFTAAFYVSHPFEDHSGKNLRNWPDNLLGLHVRFNNKQKWVTDVVYEYTNTRQQSIRDSFYVFNEKTGEWNRQENDNYFTHALYKSGFTFHQMVMSSPLFFPVQLDNTGAPTGFRAIQSTRFYAHHIGIKGLLSEHLHWKGKLTYVHHFGSYLIPYEPSRKQVSGIFEIQYLNPSFPVELGISAAADAGNVIGNNPGLQVWVAKRW
jgi:hypothetical protein